MLFRYTILALFILGTFSIIHIFQRFNYLELKHEDLYKSVRANDIESAFALGLQVKLSYLEHYDLELIPGLSEKSKTEILRRRFELLRFARENPADPPAKILARISGIGKAKSALLAQYISLE